MKNNNKTSGSTELGGKLTFSGSIDVVKEDPIQLSKFLLLNPIQRKQEFLKVLKKNLGIVSYACTELGMNRQTYYNYMEKDEDFKAEVEQIAEYTKDFVEGELFKQIASGNFVSTIFYLKTKAKDRGYVEKSNDDKQIIEVRIQKPPTFQNDITVGEPRTEPTLVQNNIEDIDIIPIN